MTNTWKRTADYAVTHHYKDGSRLVSQHYVYVGKVGNDTWSVVESNNRNIEGEKVDTAPKYYSSGVFDSEVKAVAMAKAIAENSSGWSTYEDE